MKQPFVSVKTITYNHEKFIAQCIEGVMMQKTNFDFEYVIGEDCSTDKTMEIVQKYAKMYPDVIRVITSENNVGAAENDDRTDLACVGKYIAFCEGDDFWTDPYKLQKQVDFLEANPDYGLVHTSFSCLKEDKIIEDIWQNEKIPQGRILDEILTANCIATGAVCMRNDLLKKIAIGETIRENSWRMGDYPLWIEVAAQTKIAFMPEDTTTYRIHPNSATHSLNWEGNYKFFRDRYRIKMYYAKKFGRENLLPSLDKMYHRELLKYAIFMKDEKLRNDCQQYFSSETGRELSYWLFSRYPLLDSVFELIYSLRKKHQKLQV